ncbi:MAG: hypothetical protein AAB509_02035 [Patescibacteria group bacterium]
MENLEQALGHSLTGEAQQLINGSKNIYIIPNGNEGPDSVATALALFYTLKELNKNVNIVIDETLPENLKFLIPSLDFISYPKNFVISIPNKVADVSQIFYDKDEQGLKIHLTLNKGIIKKENIFFYFSDTKPDLIITLGIKDFKDHMAKKMDSFGFLLDSPILNIDTSASLGEGVQENENFGKINLIRNSSLAETALGLVKTHTESIKKEAATCFLAGITAFTENFGNSKVTPETFETASLLMKRGADLKIIKENLWKQPQKNY